MDTLRGNGRRGADQNGLINSQSAKALPAAGSIASRARAPAHPAQAHVNFLYFKVLLTILPVPYMKECAACSFVHRYGERIEVRNGNDKLKTLQKEPAAHSKNGKFKIPNTAQNRLKQHISCRGNPL